MSSEGGSEAAGDRARAKAPRSLTLTFAESHPWEMMVRDRLAALPRGYLKRLLLSLIEHSGLDLEDEGRFRQQVERLLITRRLSRTLAAQSDEVLEREALAIEGLQRRMVSPPTQPDHLRLDLGAPALEKEEQDPGRSDPSHNLHVSAAEKADALSNRGPETRLNTGKRGFGALEL